MRGAGWRLDEERAAREGAKREEHAARQEDELRRQIHTANGYDKEAELRVWEAEDLQRRELEERMEMKREVQLLTVESQQERLAQISAIPTSMKLEDLNTRRENKAYLIPPQYPTLAATAPCPLQHSHQDFKLKKYRSC